MQQSLTNEYPRNKEYKFSNITYIVDTKFDESGQNLKEILEKLILNNLSNKINRTFVNP